MYSFGYIPNTDLMKFLANATSGTYMSKPPPVSNFTVKPNDDLEGLDVEFLLSFTCDILIALNF